MNQFKRCVIKYKTDFVFGIVCWAGIIYGYLSGISEFSIFSFEMMQATAGILLAFVLTIIGVTVSCKKHLASIGTKKNTK